MTAVDDMTVAHAHDACPDCSRPGRIVWHYENSSCPFRQRLNPVPCQRLGCHVLTRREDACCSDRCASVVASYKGTGTR